MTDLTFMPTVPKPLLAFFDATLLDWAYELWPPLTPLPDVLEAFQVVRVIIGEIWYLLPEEWRDEFAEKACAPEVMYQ